MVTGTRLTDEQRLQLRGTIEARLHALQALGATATAPASWTASGRNEREQDFEDASQRLGDYEVADEVTALDRSEVIALRNALQVVQTPAYGTCADCHEPIPFSRLELEPEATRCIACQVRVEVNA